MQKAKKADVKSTRPSAVTAAAWKNPIVLTDEQMAVVDPLLKLGKQVQTLGGLAGTGKTTLVSHMVKELKGFAVCAFTGKAAEVLRSKGVEASTIHSLIYVPQDDSDPKSSPVFELKPHLGSVKGIIVDEASMVGSALYKDLNSFGLPIIFIGDHGQLEPVGEDLGLMKSPDYKLETIHRNAGDIAKFAHHLRDGKPAAEFGESPLVKLIKKSDSTPYLLEADQVICARNATRVAINRFIRQLMKYPQSPTKGDRVISLQNSRKLGIYNGSQGIVRSVSPTRMSIAMDNGRHVKIKYDECSFNSESVFRDGYIHPVDYAYCVTCHKAQGSEWNKVMVVEEICSLWDHKRWAYTAASRAREGLFWVLAE